MSDRTHPDSGPVTPGEAGFTAADMATAAAQGFRDGVASMSLPAACGNTPYDEGPFTLAEYLPAAGQDPVVAEESRLTGDAKLAHDQCRSVVHLSQALAEVYRANASILAAGQGPVEIIGQASAEVMEIVGDILNSTDAMDEDDLWIDSIYDAAHARWPSERATSAQPAVAAGWINLPGPLPVPGNPVLLDIGKKYPIRAMWVPKFSEEVGASDFDGDEDYDEETDTSYWPEGWYEWNQYEEVHWAVSETPRAWCELPAPLPPAPSTEGESNE